MAKKKPTKGARERARTIERQMIIQGGTLKGVRKIVSQLSAELPEVEICAICGEALQTEFIDGEVESWCVNPDCRQLCLTCGKPMIMIKEWWYCLNPECADRDDVVLCPDCGSAAPRMEYNGKMAYVCPSCKKAVPDNGESR